MSNPLNKATPRLARRRLVAVVNPSKGLHKPGSMNEHKSFPIGKGRRSRATIKADSRTATSR